MLLLIQLTMKYSKNFSICLRSIIHTNPAISNIEHLSYSMCFLKIKFYPGCDVMDFLNIQDYERLLSLSCLYALITLKLSLLPKIWIRILDLLQQFLTIRQSKSILPYAFKEKYKLHKDNTTGTKECDLYFCRAKIQ